MPGRSTAKPAAVTALTAEREAWLRAVNDPTRRLGFYFGLAYVFLRFSMLHETLTILSHVNLYLALMTGLPAVVLSLMGGGLQRTAKTRAGQFWIGFLICLILSIPFSNWRGESFTVLSGYVRADFPILFILGGMVLTWKECKMVLGALAISGICTLAMERMYSSMEDTGRLSLGGGTIANSNDYAAHLLLLLPFMMWIVLTPAARIYKIVFLPLLFAGVFIDLKAGSRGALVGMAAGFLLILLKGPGKLRWILGLCGPIAVFASFSFLPASVMYRFSGLLGDSPQLAADGEKDTTGAAESAAESTAGRKYLLIKSLEYTLQHPVFGVGAGAFSSFEGGMSVAAGKRGQWQETHNAYTEISSEVGIPAVFCYIGGILSGLFILNRAMSKARRDKVPIFVTSAFCAMLSITTMAVTIFFLSLGYRFYMPALTGLAIALERVLRMDPPIKSPAPRATVPVARPSVPRTPQRPFIRESYTR